MREEKVQFYSDGYRLDASHYWPDQEVEPGRAAFVVCSGFTGLNCIHPARFARALTRVGHPCFGFDYRGFGDSEGEWGWVLLEEQISDIRNALSYLDATGAFEGRPLVLVGWGMGGGLVLPATQSAPPVDALVVCNGFYNARRVQVALRGRSGWETFQEWNRKTRAETAKTGEITNVDPFHIYPLDPKSREYVDNVLRKAPGYDGLTVRPSFADSLISFAPERHLDHLRDVPLLIVHGARNDLHPPSEAESLHGKYPGPSTLHWLPDAGHTEWMHDDNPTFLSMIERIKEWLALGSL